MAEDIVVPTAAAKYVEVFMPAEDWPTAIALVAFGCIVEARAGRFPAEAWAAAEKLAREAPHLLSVPMYTGTELPAAEAQAFAELLDKMARIGSGHTPVPKEFCYD